MGCHALIQGFGTKSDFYVVNNKENWSKCLKYWKIGSVAQSQETNDVRSTTAWTSCVEGLVGLQGREPAPSTQLAEHRGLAKGRRVKSRVPVKTPGQQVLCLPSKHPLMVPHLRKETSIRQ